MFSGTILVPAVLVSATWAADHEHREHEAHAHGHGTLDVVVEGETVLIELRLPGVNVVGFEHAPKNRAEREAVEQALEPLRDGAARFMLAPEANCDLVDATADISAIAHDHEDDHVAHEDDHHEDRATAHDHEEPDAHAGEEEHSELHATYQFRCGQPDQLERIETRVLEHLHDVEELDVRVVTPTAQLAGALHEGSNVVHLTP